jgi:hypothetical protein
VDMIWKESCLVYIGEGEFGFEQGSGDGGGGDYNGGSHKRGI